MLYTHFRYERVWLHINIIDEWFTSNINKTISIKQDNNSLLKNKTNKKQLLTMDILALVTMKNAAKCDT